MSKIEGTLKSRFGNELKLQLPEFVTQRFATAGSPDRSITGNQFVSHFEFKHATPSCTLQGNQLLFCMRLAVQGYCRYVIWVEDSWGRDKKTLIVHPRALFGLGKSHDYALVAEDWCNGHNHRYLVEYIKRIHGV